MILILWPQGFGGSVENGYLFSGSTGTCNYFRGAGEQAHSFGDSGSPAKKVKKYIKEKPPFYLIF